MRAVWLALALFVSGCALTSKATPIDYRYFSPEVASQPPAAETAVAVRTPLRLGRITSSANLRTHIVHRDSSWELGAYETLRWTDNPEVYVRRSLSRALFEDHPFAQTLGGPGATVDVEVIAFEEVRKGNTRSGRVELRWLLHDERAMLGSGTLAAEKVAAGEDIEQVVAAIALAMNDATDRVASEIAKEMVR